MAGGNGLAAWRRNQWRRIGNVMLWRRSCSISQYGGVKRYQPSAGINGGSQLKA